MIKFLSALRRLNLYEAFRVTEPSPIEAVAVPLVPLTLRVLLWPYYLAFVLCLFACIDLMSGGVVRGLLPTYPEYFFFYWIFFNFPHIVASHIVVLNPDYVRHYRLHIIAGIAVSIVVAVAIPLTLGYVALLTVFGVLTVNHVLGQQVGLTRMGLSAIRKSFFVWKYAGLVLGNLAYLHIYLKNELTPQQMTLLTVSVPALYVVATASWVLVLKEAKSHEAKKFIYANQILITAILFLSYADYSFFAIVLPRVVHDLCAFQVYWIHDSNRVAAGKQSTLLCPSSWKLSPAAATPLAALILALPISMTYNTYYGEIVAIVITLVHYWNEGFIWKRGSMLRAYLPMR